MLGEDNLALGWRDDALSSSEQGVGIEQNPNLQCDTKGSVVPGGGRGANKGKSRKARKREARKQK